MRNTQSGGVDTLTVGPEEGTFWIVRHISFVTIPDAVLGTAVPVVLLWDVALFAEIYLVNLVSPSIETFEIPAPCYLPMGYPHTLTFLAGHPDDGGRATCTIAGDMGVGSLPSP
jgi:hypothetical protein